MRRKDQPSHNFTPMLLAKFTTASSAVARFAAVGLAAALLATAGTWADAQPVARASNKPTVKPVYWPQDTFVIPYQWSASTDPANAGEVVLYLSKDQGANWSEVTRSKPNLSSFRYQANADGIFWFAVRTLDTNGRMWPTGGFSPELSVVVDTQIPTITQLEGQLDPTGRLQVSGAAADANLDSSKLQLFVRAGGDSQWVRLPVTVTDPGGGQQLLATANWQAPSGVQEVTIRMTAQDLAGNPAGAGKQIRVASQASVMPVDAPASGMPVDSPASPYPSTSQSNGPAFPMVSASRQPSSNKVTSADPFLAAPPLELPNAGGWTSSRPAPPTTTGGVPWPADARASTPFAAGTPTAWPTAQPAAQTAAKPNRTLNNSPYHQASAGSLSSRSNKATAGGHRAAMDILNREPKSVGSLAPQASTSDALMVNQSRFALEYELKSTGSWGVSKVEVWGTADDGATWRRYAIDSDNRSPVNISTDGPGRYGFQIVVQGVGSLPVEPPRPGDAPEVFVVVDEQAPTAQLGSVAQGTGYAADHLIINWRASDEHLARLPIALAYSDRPSGPWVPIASNLANDQAGMGGRYTWRLQRHLPDQLFVRLEARDRAGNVTESITPQPVSLRFSQPAAELRNARPLSH